MVKLKEKGQTLIEVIVIITIGILVIVALVFATIAGLRNAQFAKNQVQATKLAQEGLEKVRSTRDRGDPITGGFTIDGFGVDSWNDDDLWRQISNTCSPPINCYFKFSGISFQFITAASGIPSSAEDPLGVGKFQRVVILSDDSLTYSTQKKVTTIVRWTDFSGPHESRLTTILRRL